MEAPDLYAGQILAEPGGAGRVTSRRRRRPRPARRSAIATLMFGVKAPSQPC